MLSIDSKATHAIVVQKSKFICLLIPVRDILEVKKELDLVKQEFVGATHYCYAYICGSEKRASDDGEPSGTAGMPILNVLEKQNLNYILCVVVRYFGGIKLGAGGLVRAYSNSVVETLKEAHIVDLVLGKQIICTFSYPNEKQMNYVLQNAVIFHKQYQENIVYHVWITNEVYEDLKSVLNTISEVSIEQELFVTK